MSCPRGLVHHSRPRPRTGPVGGPRHVFSSRVSGSSRSRVAVSPDTGRSCPSVGLNRVNDTRGRKVPRSRARDEDPLLPNHYRVHCRGVLKGTTRVEGDLRGRLPLVQGVRISVPGTLGSRTRGPCTVTVHHLHSSRGAPPSTLVHCPSGDSPRPDGSNVPHGPGPTSTLLLGPYPPVLDSSTRRRSTRTLKKVHTHPSTSSTHVFGRREPRGPRSDGSGRGRRQPLGQSLRVQSQWCLCRVQHRNAWE